MCYFNPITVEASKHCWSAENTAIDQEKNRIDKKCIFVSQRHFGCPKYNDYPLHLLRPWLADVFDQRLFGIWRKNCAPYSVSSSEDGEILHKSSQDS
jgi:hypothetical protein